MCEPASLCSLHLGKRYCLQLLTEKIQVMLVILFIQLSALSDDSTTCKCADCWKCQRRSEETKGFDPKWVIASAAWFGHKGDGTSWSFPSLHFRGKKKEKQMFYLYSYLTFSVLLRKDLLGESVVVSVQLPVIGFVSLLTCPYTYD